MSMLTGLIDPPMKLHSAASQQPQDRGRKEMGGGALWVSPIFWKFRGQAQPSWKHPGHTAWSKPSLIPYLPQSSLLLVYPKVGVGVKISDGGEGLVLEVEAFLRDACLRFLPKNKTPIPWKMSISISRDQKSHRLRLPRWDSPSALCKSTLHVVKIVLNSPKLSKMGQRPFGPLLTPLPLCSSSCSHPTSLLWWLPGLGNWF